MYERRVLKYSEQNLEKQKELKAAHDESMYFNTAIIN